MPKSIRESFIRYALIAGALSWSAAAQAWPPLGYEGQQGTRVDGDQVLTPGEEVHRGDPVPFETDAVELGAFHVELGRLTGGNAVGHSFTATLVEQRGAAPQSGTMKVLHEQPHKNRYDGKHYGLYEYQVEWTDARHVTRPLCQKQNHALVVPGTFSNGLYTASTVAFSFACVPEVVPPPPNYASMQYPVTEGGGAAAKCVDWGYQPWVGPGPLQPPNNLTPQTAGGKPMPLDALMMNKLHQTCVLMATADYCARGGVNTVDNTWIDIYSDLSVAPILTGPNHTGPLPLLSRPLMPGAAHLKFGYETAWSPNGAICLTKKRWATLPIDTFNGGGPGCGQKLVDVRRFAGKPISADQRQTVLHSICDQQTEAELEDAGALLYNYSLFADAGLYYCNDTGGQHPLTTTDVVFPGLQGTGPFSTSVTTPLGSTLTCDVYLGALVTDPIAVEMILPGVHLERLYRHKIGSAFRTDDSPNPNGVVEGFLFPRNSPALARPEIHPFVGPKLYLWQKGASFITDISTTPPRPGYHKVRELGHLVVIPRAP